MSKPPPLLSEIRSVLTSAALIDHADKAKQPYADVQAQAIMDLLQARGHLLLTGPTAAEAHHAAAQFATEFIFAELVVKLMRTMLMGGIVIPETPEALSWLKSYIDGDGHGPVGQAMRWPEGLLGTGALLRNFGFEPTEDVPAFVRKVRKAEVQTIN